MKNETAVLTSENTVQHALAKGACPICALVRAYQNETIEQFSSSGVRSVCNYHAWAIAALSPAAGVINAFMHMLEHPLAVEENAPDVHVSCDTCALLREHERARLREFAREMQRRSFLSWIERHGTVCRVHAKQLIAILPESAAAVIASIVARNRGELKESLGAYLSNLSEGKHGGGVLGNVAEFLVAQRGLTR